MVALTRARTAGLAVECLVGGAHQLDFPSEMFAAVRADRVFQHLERPRQALAELTCVTRRDGRGWWPWIRIGTQC